MTSKDHQAQMRKEHNWTSIIMNYCADFSDSVLVKNKEPTENRTEY